MKAAKIKDWPLASVRADGMPAVWLTHSMWTILRESLMREYLNSRRRTGERRGRVDAGKPEQFDQHFLDRYCEHDRAKTAMELYQIGSQAYFKPEHREEYKHLSADDLLTLGNELETKARKETMAALAIIAEAA